MKFFFSPLVLLAILFTSAFAAPTERALSKRLLDFNFGSINFSNGPISIRDVEATVDEHRLSKRLLSINFTISNISNGIISIKRGTEKADEGLSKRSEEYNLIVSSLSPQNDLSGRSTDAYAYRHVVVSMSDTFVQALQQNGVTENQIPQYLSQNVYATDPATGYKYQLVPDGSSNPASEDDIVLNLVYQPTSP